MKMIAALTDRAEIVRVLEHLDVSTEVPRMRRSSQQREPWVGGRPLQMWRRRPRCARGRRRRGRRIGSARLLQRGERVLSTARTKGNFAYKGILVTAADPCQRGWGVGSPIHPDHSRDYTGVNGLAARCTYAINWAVTIDWCAVMPH